MRRLVLLGLGLMLLAPRVPARLSAGNAGYAGHARRHPVAGCAQWHPRRGHLYRGAASLSDPPDRELVSGLQVPGRISC